MSKFKIGDKVRPKLEVIKWYLSDEGQNSYWPSSGVLDSHQEQTLDNCNVALLALALDSGLVGEIIAHHHPSNKGMENFRVQILSGTFNISPQNLIRKKR